MKERDPEAQSEAVLDVRVDALLAALREAEPSDGLEQRVLQRLASEAPDAGRVTWMWAHLRPRLALTAGLSAGALCIAAGLLWHGAPPHDVANAKGAAIRSSAPPMSALKDATRADAGVAPKPGRAARVREDGAASRVLPKALGDAESRKGGDAMIAHSPEASFPAPAMPLTEQEQLLLQIAHRNDPVQVAMLDPVQRTLQIAQERAESARFFAPPPLPHELQQEIREALRSQYVNTPPPDDRTLDQMTNRSNP